ncbi:MAG: FGGY family carbohydrate kinase, partial [Gammaproteobacteria bacterium]|nr:FGGY family carbohydrate kinase [Gammaproteobacteria bacterium]
MHHKRDQWFLAIDQGGHASRALVYNSNGALVESTYCEIETLEKPGNIVEHDANAFLASVTKVLDELAQKLGKNLTHISSAGLACQRSSIVCWNRENGKALSPVISWQDRRTADDLHRYSAHRELIQNKTGLLLNPHYGASKMRWCLENLPAIADAEHQGTLVMSPVASYLLYHLLEQHPIVVDPANAGRTLIYDYKTGNWCDELLTVFGIKENTLPTCVNSLHSYGTIALHGHEIDFKLCTGDQSAAVFYSGMPQPDSL